MRHDAPDGRDPPLQRVVDRGHEAGRAGLGHAVADRDLGQVHRLGAAAHDLDRTGRAGHHAGAQAGEVEAGEFRVAQFGDEHRRHAVKRRAALLGDGFQGGERVEALAGKHHGRTVRDARQVADHHAEAMVERHRNAHLVALGEAHRLAEEIAVVQDVVVRQRGALRRAGGARGELDVDRIVELQLRGQFRQTLPLGRAA